MRLKLSYTRLRKGEWKSMRKSIWIIASSLVGFLCLVISSADAVDQMWGWFAATSVRNKWHIVQAEAQVRISKDVFFAELYFQKPYDPEMAVQITLRGKIRDGKIEVIAERHFTDDQPRKLKGIYKKTLWKEGGARESILLTEPDQPSGLTIGLTRELPGP